MFLAPVVKELSLGNVEGTTLGAQAMTVEQEVAA